MFGIPNYFHFVFGLKEQYEPFHLLYYLCLKSCLEVNKPEKIYFYYVHEPYGVYWELIKPELEMVKVSPVDFVSRFSYPKKGRKRLSYAHHADFIRLEQLIDKGGVYADMDTLFVQKLPDELFNKPFVLGREPEILSETTGAMEKSLCNALIMSEKGALFARKWHGAMESHFDGSWSNHSTLLPQRLSEQFPEEIHIEPQRSFYHFPWTREGLQDIFEKKKKNLEGVYSIHLWKHLWFSKWRNDFSGFNGRKLTEKYVKTAETTYASLARPFLPSTEEKNSVNSPQASILLAKKIKKGISDAGYVMSRIAAKRQSLTSTK